MLRGFGLRHGDDGDAQASTGDLGNLPLRHALLCDRVIPAAWLLLFQRQPVETSGVEEVDGRPAR